MRARALMLIAVLALAVCPAFAHAATPRRAATDGGAAAGADGGAGYTDLSAPASAPLVPTPNAQLINGVAHAPMDAPEEVKAAIAAGNALQGKPYRLGGGHKTSFIDTAYDCSGTVSFALHGADAIPSPLPSGGLMRWGVPGRGQWMTVFTNPGHAYIVIAGLRLDTSGSGGRGPRWNLQRRSSRGFVARHPDGL